MHFMDNRLCSYLLGYDDVIAMFEHDLLMRAGESFGDHCWKLVHFELPLSITL